jgi:maltooligosyltrehalose trehalohydrolase
MYDNHWKLTRGAEVQPDGGVRFTVWAPTARRLVVRYGTPVRVVPLQHVSPGIHTVTVANVSAGDHYMYLLDEDKLRPDPVSRFQPCGVHGPSAVVDPRAFVWTDATWHGLGLQDVLLYELHVGTFTEPGTFAAIIPHLDYLKHELGVTAIELMPIAEFPGARNWGYDGTHPYAPHSAYGGPHGLKALVNACHAIGLAVALDVVYNHLGPEGNYLRDYGPYFTDHYHTPWGDALNFEGTEGKEVRRYFIDNALYWVTEYHVDILRLDAVHGIFDASPVHVLQELGEAVHAQAERLGRQVVVIAESDLNDNRVISATDVGGWGLDAQWNDDFHHALHVTLTKEQHGYYRDYGHGNDLGTALTDGYIYQGQYSRFRGRVHGTPSRHLPSERFVIFSQNHDQVGNRACGERLSTLVSLPALKVAAGLVVCAPGIPLLFMGEEYGEPAPFLYFTSHADHALAELVSEGRRREFAEAAWHEAVPDPQDPETFARSKLHHHLRGQEPHRSLLRFYHEVITLRKRTPALRCYQRDHIELYDVAPHCLCLRRWATPDDHILLLASFADESHTVTISRLPGRWRKLLDSESVRDGGGRELPELLDQSDAPTLSLAPFHFALYGRIAS